MPWSPRQRQEMRRRSLECWVPGGKAIVSSGDPVADTNIREKFVAAYEAKHAIEREGDGTQTLIIGADDWPFPIPLVNKAGEWQFDTAAGLDEILRRRIGRNELAAIQVSLAYVQAQNEYASLDPGRTRSRTSMPSGS